jgi:hypothetical protein
VAPLVERDDREVLAKAWDERLPDASVEAGRVHAQERRARTPEMVDPDAHAVGIGERIDDHYSSITVARSM